MKLQDAVRAVALRNVDAAQWATTLAPFLDEYKINTENRVAAFLGQVAVESQQFTVLTENLNYSARRLLEVFGRYFPGGLAQAQQYAMRPEKLANYVYANRNGNGDVASGDGWRYRGAGLIQQTGKRNQEAFAPNHEHGDIGDYLRTPIGATQGACWFFSEHGCNELADGWQITRISKVINGGTNGLQERIKFSNLARRAL